MFFSNFINHFFWRGTYRNAIKHIMQKGEIISDPFWQYGWPKKWHFASLIQGVSVCEGSFAWEAVLKNYFWGDLPQQFMWRCHLCLWWYFLIDIFCDAFCVYFCHTLYLSFFLHGQNFWRIKFTLKRATFSRKICRKCQFFALNL